MERKLLFTGRHFWNRKCRKKTWWQQEFAVFKCEATANSVTGHVCVNSNKSAAQREYVTGIAKICRRKGVSMQKQKRKTNHIHRAACALLAGLALSLGLLTGCGSDGSTIVVGKKNEKGYSRAEVMVIAMTEKKRYEEVCTDQIWGVSVGEKGDDFETYLKKQIRSFMDELKIMNLLAADRGISLTSEERAAMDRAAAEYFGRLPQSAIDSMGVTEADVQHIYEDYGLAEKLAGQLTDNVALEVSDSEAKVIHVKQIKTSDESEADAFQRAASQEDADFQSCAEEAGLTVSDRVLGRGDESDAYEKEAFSLAEGAVSQVIHADDAYYVLKCTDDYDEDETAARKERIYEERKKRAFQEIYDRFSNTISVSYSSGLWDSLDLTSEFEKNDADFFEIYAEYAIK